MTTQTGDIWGRGEAYERYVGRWSRHVGREFLAWLDVPPGGRWLDVGSGTGALSGLILELADPADVQGIDPAEGFVPHARAHVTDPRATFTVGDARMLPLDAGSFDAVVGGLMLNFVPEPTVAVGEMTRVARPGGRIGVYVWDYAGGMQFMRRFWDAATALDPAAAALDEGRKFDTVTKPDGLHALFTGAGLREVETRAIEIPTRFADFDDYWSPFLGGQGPGPGYVATLDDDRRAALRERLRATLPADPDGSIPLTARAWAARGRR
jgi:SAM-dependent methyltransferase